MAFSLETKDESPAPHFGGLKSASKPSENGTRPPMVCGEDVDSDQQPEILEQWHLGIAARSSIDPVLNHLGQNGQTVVKRKIVHYPGGEKASQETTVVSDLPGKRLLYAARDAWSLAGTLTSSFRQINALNGDGFQTKGRRSTLNFEDGLLCGEKLEQWSPVFTGWFDTYARTTTYYGDDDMKGRVTMLPAVNQMTKEDWGAKLEGKRLKTTCRWDEASQGYGPSV
jgi:hypothetical protein